jgi:hypothetical protein
VLTGESRLKIIVNPMKILTEITDRNGVSLELGDVVDLLNWGVEGESLGLTQIIWDVDQGRVSCDPLLVEDPYDFWTKALPRCKKVK